MTLSRLLPALTLCLAASALAAEPRLRGDVTVLRDVLTLSDLVDGVSGPEAERPLFGAPAPGQTGTIQARRVLEAAQRLGFPVPAAEVAHVTVTRAARRVEPREIEEAVRRALELRQVDARAITVVLDAVPALVAAAEAEPVGAEDLAFDPRSRRFSALVRAPGAEPARVTGTAVELVTVGVLAKPLNRGDAVQDSDLSFERRPREKAPSDAIVEGAALAGRIARRPLPAGTVLRAADLARPELVGRGDIVTVAYEIPGMNLTLRARANESGAEGDTVAVTNLQSKKILHATIVGPGRVAVSAPTPGPVAAVPAAIR